MLMVTRQETKEKDLDQLVEREKELKEQIEKSKIDTVSEEEKTEPLGFKPYVTRMVRGEVIDIDYKDRSDSVLTRSRKSKLILHVKTDEGLCKVAVSDKGDYSEENELVRLLEWKGIRKGRIGDLIDKEVTLRLTDYRYSRNSDVDSSDLEVYIPGKLDIVGKASFWTEYFTRLTGLGILADLLKGEDDNFLVTMISSLFLTCGAFIFSIFWALIAVVTSIIGLGGTPTSLLAFLLTVSLGLMCKLAADVKRKYTNYRDKDSIRG